MNIKRFFLFLALSSATLLATGKILADIPTAKMHIISLEHYDPFYVKEELESLLEEEMFFSFLSIYQDYNAKISRDVDLAFAEHNAYLHTHSESDNGVLKVAILLPSSEIGAYAMQIPNSVLNYFIFNQTPFEIKVFNFVTQNSHNLDKAIKEATDEGFSSIILVATQSGVQSLLSLSIPSHVNILIPTININDIEEINLFPSNIYFGAISYKDQMDKLLETLQPKKIAIYSENSMVSTNIADYLHAKEELNITAEHTVKDKNVYFKKLIDIPEIDNNVSVIVNTPIVTSSIILSNLSYYQKEVRNILSTQINYRPSIFHLTQEQDLKQLYLANSNIQRNDTMDDISQMTNNDIRYDWVNYTSTLGVDYLVNIAGYKTAYFNFKVKDNQLLYDIELVQPREFAFKPADEKEIALMLELERNATLMLEQNWFMDFNLSDFNLSDFNFSQFNLPDMNWSDFNLSDVNWSDVNQTDFNITDFILSKLISLDYNATDFNATDSNATDSDGVDSNNTNNATTIDTERDLSLEEIFTNID